jgi:hypothetical protein
MTVSTPSRTCTCAKGASDTITATELQNALLQAITGLTQLVSQLSQQFPIAKPAAAAEPWMEERDNAVNQSSAPRCSANLTPFWDELSVKKLRSFLRSYPIDRYSLPAPIELLRRSELIEALNQIQALGA